jgi:hypothetical protein
MVDKTEKINLVDLILKNLVDIFITLVDFAKTPQKIIFLNGH